MPDTVIDFRPETGNSYNIEWTGPPRRALTYSDVKFYIPLIDLSGPATTDHLRRFQIKVDRSWWWDKQIGEFEAIYLTGQIEPSVIRYASALEDALPPANAPAETTKKFWLGCTRKGKVKGNIDKHSSSARVYLEEEDRQLSANTILIGRISPRHTVKCTDIETGGQSGGQPQGPCGPYQKCCGQIIGDECIPGPCWPQTQQCPDPL